MTRVRRNAWTTYIPGQWWEPFVELPPGVVPRCAGGGGAVAVPELDEVVVVADLDELPDVAALAIAAPPPIKAPVTAMVVRVDFSL